MIWSWSYRWTQQRKMDRMYHRYHIPCLLRPVSSQNDGPRRKFYKSPRVLIKSSWNLNNFFTNGCLKNTTLIWWTSGSVKYINIIVIFAPDTICASFTSSWSLLCFLFWAFCFVFFLFFFFSFLVCVCVCVCVCVSSYPIIECFSFCFSFCFCFCFCLFGLFVCLFVCLFICSFVRLFSFRFFVFCIWIRCI